MWYTLSNFSVMSVFIVYYTFKCINLFLIIWRIDGRRLLKKHWVKWSETILQIHSASVFASVLDNPSNCHELHCGWVFDGKLSRGFNCIFGLFLLIYKQNYGYKSLLLQSTIFISLFDARLEGYLTPKMVLQKVHHQDKKIQHNKPAHWLMCVEIFLHFEIKQIEGYSFLLMQLTFLYHHYLLDARK